LPCARTRSSRRCSVLVRRADAVERVSPHRHVAPPHPDHSITDDAVPRDGRLYTPPEARSWPRSIPTRSHDVESGRRAEYVRRRIDGGVHLDLGNVVLTRQGARLARARSATARPRFAPTICSCRAAGDVKPGLGRSTRVAIPQADEHQRLLANIIPAASASGRSRGSASLEREAKVAMSGDDHGNSGSRTPRSCPRARRAALSTTGNVSAAPRTSIRTRSPTRRSPPSCPGLEIAARDDGPDDDVRLRFELHHDTLASAYTTVSQFTTKWPSARSQDAPYALPDVVRLASQPTTELPGYSADTSYYYVPPT
jgi:hypothetical protein